MDAVEQANALLRERGYAERDLAVYAVAVGQERAILKGASIVSPFADSAETVLKLVRDCVPTAADLGKRPLRPAELRAKL
jgi:hypothetical protein